MLTAKIDKTAKTITITLPWDEKGADSASGKTKVHASSRGNQALNVDGKTISVGVNVYSPKS